MNLQTVRCFTKAMKYGSKYVYQTVPRLLTIWLDMGEDGQLQRTDVFSKVNQEVSRAIKGVPAYKASVLAPFLCIVVLSVSSGIRPFHK